MRIARPEAFSKSDRRWALNERPTGSPSAHGMSAGTRALIMPSAVSTATIWVVPRYSVPIDRAAQLRGIVEADVLRPDAEREVGRREILADLRHGDVGALDDDLLAPFCSPPPNFKKFIGGEPMKSATNIEDG